MRESHFSLCSMCSSHHLSRTHARATTNHKQFNSINPFPFYFLYITPLFSFYLSSASHSFVKPLVSFSLSKEEPIFLCFCEIEILGTQIQKMMVQRDQDLGLSLSLSYPAENRATSLHLNLMPSSSSPSPFTIINNNSSWTQAFSSSDRRGEACREETRSFLKGIDVNCLPETAEEEEEGGVSSPNSTISSISGKRSEREATDDGERASSRGGISDEEDAENARKKLRLSKDQSAILEESFKEHNTLNPKQKMALAKRLGLRPRQVEVWFQNRRARTKLKQTEVDCEFLKRCCENLTEENRRLQKEVQELRALKLSPQLYMQMTPPTTLTMCPSCERVALPSAASVDPRPLPMGSAQPRPIPFNPWPAAPRCRPFNALHSRS
ncbi:homeobox-leucine zipper protein HAT4-like [Salvia miltiorrhiza]|uniref:homeobox-leucine zipper protein HAT4-like n=1 Tax=Salvia miltiorrhiza TaxID=226208 RepID=UPI0025AC39F5|nr:homeobox-leucine zipper protein HAT4-like [Salvia miltiorrhiza]